MPSAAEYLDEKPSASSFLDESDERPLERESRDFAEPEILRPQLTDEIPDVGGGIPSRANFETLEAEARKQSRLGEEIAGTMAEAELVGRTARVFEPNLPRNLLAPTTEEFLSEGEKFRAGMPLEMQPWQQTPLRPPTTAAELSPETRESLAAGQAASGTLADLSSADQAVILGGAALSGGIPGAAGRILHGAIPATFGVEGAKSIYEGAKTLLSDDATPEERGAAKFQIGMGATMLPGLGALAKRPPVIVERTIAKTEAAAPGALSKSKVALADVSISSASKEVAKMDTAKREPISDQAQQLEKPIEKGIPDEAIQVQEAQGPQDVLKDVAREKEIEIELSNLAARRGRFDPANPRMEALRTEMRALQARRETAPKAEPPGPEKFEVSVQAEDPANPGTGFVQIVDTAVKSEKSKSPTVESLRAAGVDVPDFSKLPTGKYTWKEAVEKAKSTEAATAEPPGVATQIPARQAPVVEPGVGAVPQDVPAPKTAERRADDANQFREAMTPQKSRELVDELRKDGWTVSGVSARGKLFDHVEISYRGRKVSEADTTTEGWRKIMDGEAVPSTDTIAALHKRQEALQAEFNKKYGPEWSGKDLSPEEAARWKASTQPLPEPAGPKAGSLPEVGEKNTGRVSLPDRGSVEKYSGLSLEPVERLVGGITEHNQILKAVVENLPVDVVDILASRGVNAEKFVREPSLFINGLPVDMQLPVSNGIRASLSHVGTLLRAGLADAFSTGVNKELLPALRASDLNTDLASQLAHSRRATPNDVIGGAKVGGADVGVKLPGTGEGAKSGLVAVGSGGGKPAPAELAKFVDWHKRLISEAGEQVKPSSEPTSQLGAAESKLAEVVNQTIEQSSPTRLGVSPAATMRPMDVVLGAPDLRSISPAVEARWQQAVKGTEGIIDKVKTQAGEAWKSITREYADLPPREFPAEIDVLRRQRASPNASARTAVDVLKGITNNLGPKQYGVFNRVALLEDLVKDVESGKYATGNDLPFGYKDAGELTADLSKFRAVAESTPQIKAALERRREFMDAMRGTLVARGFLPESVLSDPRYFHHQVLLYMAEKNAPAGSRSFRDWFSGWQKTRTGSSKDYNRQYVEAEAEVLADAFNKFTNQDLHGEMQGIADIASQLKEVHGAEWRQHIPKSYTAWQPKRGNIFYQVQTVAERVMDRYLSGLGDILPSEFREALAVGGRRQEWVIPKPLAKVLDNIAPRPDNWIGNLATTMHRSWRKYILLNPLRAAKYNLNNLSGDLDFLFAAQPKIFKEFKGAAPDMWGFHVKGKSATGDIKDAMQDGVIGSGWRASELPDIARSDYFNWLTGEKPKLVDRYWNWIGKRTDAREDTGRLASYRFAKKEWEAGRPFYGASVPADVNALATPRQKAAKVAREILIDYGRGTEFSNFMRAKIAPFFKWMEGNFARYQQLIRNIPEHEGAGPRVAGAAGKKAATLALRMGAAYGIINLWNHMFFPKEEEELGEGRNQLHLILGRDDQGNVQSIRFQGALSDLLGWVGGEDLPQDVQDVASGKASMGDKMEDAYEAGISRAVNASLPFPKTAAEIGLGRSFYPNALSPRPVRDKAEHAAGLFSLKPVYQWLAGQPHKPLRQEIANLISYTTDPGEAAYNTTRHMAGEWLEENGEERANVIPGKRSNALYYYKQALRYKDQATAKKFLDEYNRLGGKREGLTQSIKASAPLSMLGNKSKAFLDSLSPQEREAVRRAEEWYRRVYARPPAPNPNP